jgi:hypothetical protein
MAGYRIGSQAWYDATRKRLIDISTELQKPEAFQDEKNRLYDEQVSLIEALQKHSNENHVNNPIV